MTQDRDLFRSAVGAMSGYVPGEQPRDRRYIKLNTNENPYPPSPRVLEALQAAISGDLRLYPDPLATAVRNKAANVYGVSADRILVGNGSDDLLTILIRTCVDPVGTPDAAGRAMRVAYPTPTYTLYETLAAIQGCETCRVPFGEDFALPVDALLACDARLTIICNPNAPTGTLTPVEVVREVVERARGIVAIDEAYVDFARESCLRLVDDHENVVILRTMSKSYSLAGMRIGLAIASREMIRQFEKVKDSYNLSRLSLVAAEAAIEDQAYMRANVDRVRRSRAELIAALLGLGMVVLPSETNFVWARLPGQSLESFYLALKARGVLVRYFDRDGLRDAVRITIGLPEENQALVEAVRDVLVGRDPLGGR